MQVLKGLALGLTATLLLATLVMLSMAFTLDRTVLQAGFTTREIQKLDSAEVARELLPDSLPGQLEPYSAIIDTTVLDMKPWITSQIGLATTAVYDYLSNKTPSLDVSISIDPVWQDLFKNFDIAYAGSPPPGYSQLSATQQKQRRDQAKQELIDLMPQDVTLNINESNLSGGSAEALDSLKKAYSYTRTAYPALAATAVVLLLTIILILRSWKVTTRTLGIVGLLAGTFGYALFRLMSNLLPRIIDTKDLPSQFQVWVPGLISDVLSPLGIFGLVVLVAGGLLLASSFFFRSDH
jgi:hypothetical protein